MTKVIKNGTVVTADRAWQADVLIVGDTSKAIGIDSNGEWTTRRENRLFDLVVDTVGIAW